MSNQTGSIVNMEIEPRIKPLVDALNATGLVDTFSSCEGHFLPPDPDDFSERTAANVGFELREGIDEQALVTFFAALLSDFMSLDPDLKWRVKFEIKKTWVPDMSGGMDIEPVYWFHIRPFNPHEGPTACRRETDAGIAFVTSAVLRRAPQAPRS